MKVFILIEYDWEESYIVEVFLTKEKADKAMMEGPKHGKNNHLVVEEWEVTDDQV